ncbi:hypothetical protein SAMN06265365_10255 [Tistlia consotensis]|uniref:Sulphur transport domain-containing protein n=1 Tax=Tistlia consotensis USBA 355 TaxID=560819 RepID=A0A1Y6BH37_9PROT|nr:DUF6691 family protein [Tistlia consotensis]SMF09654.1 hypothetical protein SAMN05428998_104261 [Tistlia consotensis USBA 355]SNR34341.1 hypothetical protein SAMN06265365_10255 [Tistlia consotensis]
MMTFLRLLAALGTGSLFGFGLALSGMVDAGRVRGFLDVAGAWDPSLAFVLAGAVGVALPGFRLARRFGRPLLEVCYDLPGQRRIDWRLVTGAVLFGVGWGLAGFCPGPAVAALSFVGTPALLFVAAMLAGMVLHDRLVAPRLAGRSAAGGQAGSLPGAAR